MWEEEEMKMHLSEWWIEQWKVKRPKRKPQEGMDVDKIKDDMEKLSIADKDVMKCVRWKRSITHLTEQIKTLTLSIMNFIFRRFLRFNQRYPPIVYRHMDAVLIRIFSMIHYCFGIES